MAIERRRRYREFRVGVVLLGALILLAVGILLIGEENNVFTRKARYFVRFGTAAGLSEGSPVQLNGVRVGLVERVRLPEEIDNEQIVVWVAIDRRYAARVRADSVARIKTLGLLGDKYIEITSGSADFPQTADHGEIQTAGATDVDKLLASGEDVVENVVGISHSLKNILGNMERGEGVLGVLVTESPESKKMRGSLAGSLQSINRIADAVEQGKGPLGRMIHDEKLGDDLAGAVARFNGILDKAEHGQGLMPALLDDPRTREKFLQTLDAAHTTADSLADFAGQIQRGEGLVPKLLNDKEYGEHVTKQVRDIVDRLNRVSAQLESGNGTVPRLLNDPSVYDAVNDILVGVNDSKMLRWLIRNRQKKGIERRYEEERKRQGLPPGNPADPSAPQEPPGR